MRVSNSVVNTPSPAINSLITGSNSTTPELEDELDELEEALVEDEELDEEELEEEELEVELDEEELEEEELEEDVLDDELLVEEELDDEELVDEGELLPSPSSATHAHKLSRHATTKYRIAAPYVL